MVTENKRTGKLVIISGPSGVGKGTICSELAKRLPNVYISISVTTRKKAAGEVDGKDYFFVSQERFRQLIEEQRLLEYAQVFGNFYGTPKDNVEQALAAGKIVILEIDVQGGCSVKAVKPDAIMIFILPPDRSELARRLTGRGRDAEEAAKKRLQCATGEITEAWKQYNNMVVNDDLEKAVQQVIDIIGKNSGENK